MLALFGTLNFSHLAPIVTRRLMRLRDNCKNMTDSHPQPSLSDIDRAISLTEAALTGCDDAGLIFPAIDISSALEKLKAIRKKLDGN